MRNMTKDEALKLALEVLNRCGSDSYVMEQEAITAIKEALMSETDGAQPEQSTPCGEPVAWRTFDGEGGYDYRTYEMNENYAQEWDRQNPKHKGWVDPLYTAPPKAQPEQESVAWVRWDEEVNYFDVRRNPPSKEAVEYLAKWNRPPWVPAYPYPPQRKPLSEKRIKEIYQKYGTSRLDGFNAAIREAESDHDITGVRHEILFSRLG